MKELIHIKELTRVYEGKVMALDHVNLTIHQGEWLAMMGPSGSGKTTLLSILGCLDQPTEGEVYFENVLISGMTAAELTRFRREKIGFVFQQFHLMGYLTALENVMIAQYYHSMVDRKEAEKALADVGLAERMHHYPSQLSGGEQQRVCVARALINKPKLILADEPTGNLDEASEEMVLALFKKLHQDGHTILMVTHDVHVGKLADRQIQLDHGRVVGNFLTSLQAEEDIENLLKQLWELREESKLTLQHLKSADFLDHAATIKFLQTKGDMVIENSSIHFSSSLEDKMRDIVRRHRLGEILFSESLHMDKEQSAVEACQFEHMLNADITERICHFFHHPRKCPHGKPIPPGNCCQIQEAS